MQRYDWRRNADRSEQSRKSHISRASSIVRECTLSCLPEKLPVIRLTVSPSSDESCHHISEDKSGSALRREPLWGLRISSAERSWLVVSLQHLGTVLESMVHVAAGGTSPVEAVVRVAAERMNYAQQKLMKDPHAKVPFMLGHDRTQDV